MPSSRFLEGAGTSGFIQDTVYIMSGLSLAMQNFAGKGGSRGALSRAPIDFGIVIGAMPASRAAAGAALEVIGRREDEIWPVEVVVFRLKGGRREGQVLVHLPILS
jgi:hypothetical protein